VDIKKYLKISEGNINNARRLANETEEGGWKFIEQKDGVSIYSRSIAGSAVMCMRGDGVIRASPEVVFLTAFCMEDRPKWDAMYERGSTIDAPTPTLKISHLMFKGTLMIYSSFWNSNSVFRSMAGCFSRFCLSQQPSP
jgi:hypothetical protein